MARKSIDWMKTIPELLNEWNYEKNNMLNWNPSFQFASLSSDLANRLHK